MSSREEPLADLAAGHETALASCEGRVRDLEAHAHRGLVDGERRPRLHLRGIAQRVGDAQRLDARDRDDVPGRGFRHRHTREPREAEHLEYPAAAPLAVAIHDDDGDVASDRAALDPADADGAHIARIGERADLHLEGAVPVDAGRGDIGDDGLEEHLHVAALVTVIRAAARVAPQGGGEHHAEVELLLARPQAIEEVEGLVHDPRRARAGPVDLVHDHDGLETAREGLLGHEARLWHGAVHGIDEQQHGIHHRQDPLHLAAEIGMSRGIDDVDPIVPPAQRRILGEDSDPALPLQLVRVHDAFDAPRALAQGPGLLQQAVDERGLAVVDVCDDGDVAKSFRQTDASRHGRSGT